MCPRSVALFSDISVVNTSHAKPFTPTVVVSHFGINNIIFFKTYFVIVLLLGDDSSGIIVRARVVAMSMALKKVKGTLERVLDKNLQDLVRGIRNHKDSEVLLI